MSQIAVHAVSSSILADYAGIKACQLATKSYRRSKIEYG